VSAAPLRRRAGLGAHIERTIASLTARRGGAPPALDEALAKAVRELDLLLASGKAPKGDARARVLQALRALDGRLLSDVRSSLTPDELDALEREADESLAPFRQRLPETEWARARSAAVDRAVRTALRLPTLASD
jgi:hypothetical protein